VFKKELKSYKIKNMNILEIHKKLMKEYNLTEEKFLQATTTMDIKPHYPSDKVTGEKMIETSLRLAIEIYLKEQKNQK
jgi:hypothetical protein